MEYDRDKIFINTLEMVGLYIMLDQLKSAHDIHLVIFALNADNMD